MHHSKKMFQRIMETVPVLTITFFKMKSEVPFLGEA
jgi:hypothetical protein